MATTFSWCLTTALLYQTGYLTIKDYDFWTDTVTLGVSNKEVEESLFERLMPFYINVRRCTAMGVVFTSFSRL